MLGYLMDKIKSFLIVAAVVVCAMILFSAYAIIVSPSRILRPLAPAVSSQASSTATIDGRQFKLHLAVNPIDQQKGLSVFDSLSQDEGMLFVFPTSSYYGFWMKDMKFPIDILWIQGDTLAGFQENALALDVKNPDNLPVYNPPEPVNEVLEINAGLAEKYGFKAGDKVFVKLAN